MTIAAVPSYLLNRDFSTASPAMRFGMYLPLWNRSFDKEKETVESLKRVSRLNNNDVNTLNGLVKRQAQLAQTAQQLLTLEAVAIAPFATGLGNEHPTENGFAFLNPYGLPYLPGSGVKGVLRQAARELASGEWGDSNGWSGAAITALFGLESVDGAAEHQRGALVFWDVIPQIKGDRLAVEIMTPHQKHYYQETQTPHDSGQPVPISFLSLPAGSSFTFYVQCNKALLPDLLRNNQWQALLQSAFEHAFNWLGFGAKTAVGYGAMTEDAARKAEREEQRKAKAELERRSELTPEDLAYENNCPTINSFREAFEKARVRAYQPGQEFDSQRNVFVEVASEWGDLRSRLEAADLLSETIKWGVSKKGKARLNSIIQFLRGSN